NDKHGGIVGRSRQSRSFLTMRPDRPFVYLVWECAVPKNVLDGLHRLCSKVTRIGHSSSLVQMWVVDDPAEINPDWRPDNVSFDQQMRVAEPGTLAYLEALLSKTIMASGGWGDRKAVK
ncbi:MAG: type I-U CRISPR-associated protein Csb2, partial [Bryobacteraceae bacterium]